MLSISYLLCFVIRALTQDYLSFHPFLCCCYCLFFFYHHSCCHHCCCHCCYWALFLPLNIVFCVNYIRIQYHRGIVHLPVQLIISNFYLYVFTVASNQEHHAFVKIISFSIPFINFLLQNLDIFFPPCSLGATFIVQFTGSISTAGLISDLV